MTFTTEYKIKKKYFHIEIVARLLKESQSTIRYWEKEFAVKIGRSSSNKWRQYTRSDVKILKWIKFLLRVCKYTIAGAKIQLEIALKSEILN